MTIHDEALYTYINSISPLSRDWFDELYKKLEFRQYSKGEVFIQRNEPDHLEYFLLDGICRSYLLNTEKEEVTISFFKGVSFLSPSSIRTANGVSLFNYQALTDITVGCIEAKAFLNLLMHISEIRSFRNAMLHQELLQKVEKEVALASLSPKDRLQHFKEKYPALENTVPQDYIASYLSLGNSGPDQ
jgi:CRP-like cAMP-binding protein